MKKFKILLVLLLCVFLNNLIAQNTSSYYHINKQNEKLNTTISNINSFLADTSFGDLIVGYFNPNETVIIDTNTIISGDVIIVNNGSLTINTDTFGVSGNIVCLNKGELNIKNTVFSVMGDIGLIDSASFDIDSSEFRMPMDFLYQYSLLVVGRSKLSIKNSLVDFKNGALGVSINNNSSMILENDTFNQHVTASMRNESSLNINNVLNAWEFLIMDSCDVNINNSSGLILWLEFPDNTVSSLSFPQGSFVSNFTANNTVTGLNDIPYSLNITNTSNVNWGIFPQKGSDLTINNSYLRTCGLIFEEGAKDTLTGFYNDQFYSNTAFPINDRNLKMVNSTIRTWNFYSFDSSRVSVVGCFFGEALSFNNGYMEIIGSICDGSGGYLGAEKGQMIVVNSDIQCMIMTKDRSNVFFIESDISGINAPMGKTFLNDYTIAFWGNTNYHFQPDVRDTSILLEIYIDSLVNAKINSIVPITGITRLHNGPFSPAFLHHYSVYYSTAAQPDVKYLIKDSITTEVYNDIICMWNTNGLATGNYILHFSAFLNDDTTSVDLSREIFLEFSNSINNLQQNALMKVYPNPMHDKGNVSYYIDNQAIVSASLYDVSGRLINCFIENEYQKKGHHSFQIQGNELNKGVYFIKLEAGDDVIFRKIIML